MFSEGVLTKRAVRSGRNWKDRYFRLAPTKSASASASSASADKGTKISFSLFYYKNQTDFRPKGAFPIDHSTTVEARSVVRNFCYLQLFISHFSFTTLVCTLVTGIKAILFRSGNRFCNSALPNIIRTGGNIGKLHTLVCVGIFCVLFSSEKTLCMDSL